MNLAVKDLTAASGPGPISPEASGNRFLFRGRELLRLAPFDTSTEAGRSKERYRRATLTTISSAVAMATSLLTTLISVRLTVRYLGVERYGLWMTIISFLAMLSFADLGMGNGLLNAISDAHGKDNHESARKNVTSAFLMLSAVAILMLLVFAILYPFVPWPRLFNVSSPLAARECGPAMVVFVSCFLLDLPLGVVQRIQMGYQKGFVSNLWRVAGSLIGLGGLLLAIHLRKGLPLLVLAMVGGPLVADLLNSITEFGWSKPSLMPEWGFFDQEAARRILVLGSQFFLLQIAGAVAFASDNIVAAQVCGPSAVTQYAVPMRLFTTSVSVVGLFNNPLWPAYGEAAARGDINWAKRTLIRSLGGTTILSALLATILALFGKPIVHLWVGSQIQPSFSLLLGMATWSVLGTLGGALAIFLNATNRIRFEILCALPLAFTAVLGKIFLAHWVGIPGIIWGLVIAYTLTTVVPCAVYIPKVLSTLEQGPSQPIGSPASSMS
jgi:O-antigen/teichoic acid export membrane protein